MSAIRMTSPTGVPYLLSTTEAGRYGGALNALHAQGWTVELLDDELRVVSRLPMWALPDDPFAGQGWSNPWLPPQHQGPRTDPYRAQLVCSRPVPDEPAADLQIGYTFDDVRPPHSLLMEV